MRLGFTTVRGAEVEDVDEDRIEHVHACEEEHAHGSERHGCGCRREGVRP